MIGQRKKENIQPHKADKKSFHDKFEDISKFVPDDIKNLVQELRAHQVELEVQIEKFKSSQEALRKSLGRYQKLYDNIPVGYLIIGKNYAILEANTAIAKMLSISRRNILKSKLTDFIANTRESKDALYLPAQKISKNHFVRECELEMQRSDDSRFFAHLQFTAVNKVSKQLSILVQDITERKKTEKALYESEAQFHSVLDNSRDLIYRVNLKTNRFEYISPSIKELLGFSSDEYMAMDVMSTITRIHSDDLPAFQATINSLKDTEKAEIEYRQRAKSGNYIWFSNRMSLVKDSRGIPLYRIGNIHDISKRKKAEEKLRESEELFSRAFHSNVAAFTVTNIKDGLIIDTNEAYKCLTGYSGEELIGHKTTELGLWADPVQRKEIIERLYIDGKVRNVDVKVRNKEGRLIDTIFSMEIIHLHGQDLALSTAIDITDRKNAEEAILRAKDELEIKVKERTAQIFSEHQRLFDVLETLPVMVCLLTPDYHTTFANKAFREKFGESNGRYCYDYCGGFNEPCSFCESQKPFKTGKPHRWEFVSSDGNTIIDAYDFPFTDINGSPLVLEMGIDITERKKMEQQLKSYAWKITQVQEDERKRIAYELHDDTAQYLSILKMQLGALVSSGKIQSEEIREKLRYLEDDANRAFNDVRRYSHELRPSVLEHMGLRASIEQIAEDINKLNHFKVEIEVEGKEPELSEEIKLGFFRIAQEALNNTRKHAKASQAMIKLKFNRKLVSMEVVDNGIGFRLLDARNKSSEKGSLGLMSMKERADLIGANLNIKSNPDIGTIVSVEMSV